MPLFLDTPICPLYTHVLVTSLCIRLGYFCIHTVTGCLNSINLYRAFTTRPPHCPDWSPPESSCPCDLSGMQHRYPAEGSVVFMLLPPLLPWPTSCRLSEHVFHQDCASYRGGNDSMFSTNCSPIIEKVTRDQIATFSVEHNFVTTDLPAPLALGRGRDEDQMSAPLYLLHAGQYSLADCDTDSFLPASLLVCCHLVTSGSNCRWVIGYLMVAGQASCMSGCGRIVLQQIALQMLFNSVVVWGWVGSGVKLYTGVHVWYCLCYYYCILGYSALKMLN